MTLADQGRLAFAVLLAALLLSALPVEPVSAVVLGFGSLWLETLGVPLLAGYRFSPATPLLLTVALCPGLGPGLAVAVVLLDAVARLEAGFWVNLGQRLALALALLGVALAGKFAGHLPYLPALLGPLLYLAVRLGGESRPPSAPEERAIWRQLHLRIRPLEAGTALAAPLFAVAVVAHPVLSLLLLPLLASTRAAAENALLVAHDQSLGELLGRLKGAEKAARQVGLERDRAQEEKRLLEGFSSSLAGRPGLAEAASQLVATVHGVLAVDTVVVFLGQPCEPYSYRTGAVHTAALQGAALTQLREPLVDRALAAGKPVLQKSAPAGERLLARDVVAAALPLGAAGVLYVGRETAEGFGQAGLDRLKWLAEKAALAFEAAYQTHQEELLRRRQAATVVELREKVASLSGLVQGAEEMASTLDARVLLERLSLRVEEAVPSSVGLLRTRSGLALSWGGALSPPGELLTLVRGAQRPLVFEDMATSRFGSFGAVSLLACPLLAGRECVGYLLVGVSSRGYFSGELVDFLHLLCSQAAMALSNAGLYSDVVEARRQLEASQASLVQSSKLTAIGQLAAGVAHELNSPLGAVSLSVDEALNHLEERPALAGRLLVKAQEGVERSKAIINRLMTYSRKPVGVSQRLALGKLAEETLEFLIFQLRSSGTEVAVEVSGEGLVEGEEQPLQQVVTNLVMNAVQAMDGCTPRRLSLSVRDENGHVVMDVADSGRGVLEEHRERLFDPFFTTKPAGKGTGLGLWASQQIVTQHGGTLEFAPVPAPGQGTVFTVGLPAASSGST